MTKLKAKILITLPLEFGVNGVYTPASMPYTPPSLPFPSRSYGTSIEHSELPLCSQSAISIFQYPTDFVLDINNDHSAIYVPNADRTHRLDRCL